MTTATATRAASVALIHLGPINASRRRAGLAAMTLAEVESEFADVNHSPPRTKGVARRTFSNADASAMWTGIVSRLNSTIQSRAPVAMTAGSNPEKPVAAAVDWSSIAGALNTEAGLAMPARRTR
jgi:hypothetical protein